MNPKEFSPFVDDCVFEDVTFGVVASAMCGLGSPDREPGKRSGEFPPPAS
jgi:hypothetical protein